MGVSSSLALLPTSNGSQWSIQSGRQKGWCVNEMAGNEPEKEMNLGCGKHYQVQSNLLYSHKHLLSARQGLCLAQRMK